jgi:hypothetical protein
MKSKNLSLILAVGAVLLLVGALAAALWPMKTDEKISCGSFLAASSSVYNDAYQRRLSVADDAKGRMTESERQLARGIQILTGSDPEANFRKDANLAVSECADERQTGGIVAGVLLLLGLGAGGTYLAKRGRSGTAAA